MELFSPKLEFRHLLVGNPEALRIDIGVDLAFHGQAGRRGGCGDEVDNDLVADEWLATPVLADNVSGGGGGSHFGGRAGTTPPKLSSGDRTLAGLHGVFRGKKAHTAEPRLAGKKRKPERRGRGHPIFAIEY